ncbi:MAG: AraC family transcriptional regulator [Planctomycetales bacterium]|nr:AraC family transcriptional regulator [Planctomycetales bacterium]
MTTPTRPPVFFSSQVRAAKRFYLDLSRRPQRGLAVACGGREDCAADYRIDRSGFPFHAIEFVCGGRGRITLDGVVTELSAGVVYSYGPKTRHLIESDAGEPLEKYFVNFAGREADAALAKTHLPAGAARRVLAPLDVQSAFNDLIRHGGHSTTAPCDALLQYLLALIATQGVAATAIKSAAYVNYERCRAHLEAHSLRLRSLDEAADELAIDKAYLCRLFQRFDNRTPHQYLTHLRMNRAAELLADHGRLIKQVAAAVGYQDVFHFSRAFKGVFGVSPRKFRELLA